MGSRFNQKTDKFSFNNELEIFNLNDINTSLYLDVGEINRDNLETNIIKYILGNNAGNQFYVLFKKYVNSIKYLKFRRDGSGKKIKLLNKWINFFNQLQTGDLVYPYGKYINIENNLYTQLVKLIMKLTGLLLNTIHEIETYNEKIKKRRSRSRSRGGSKGRRRSRSRSRGGSKGRRRSRGGGELCKTTRKLRV